MRISDQIQTGEAGGVTLRLLHTPVESVISFSGSFDTHPDLSLREDLIQEVAVELLDKGTKTKDRFQIATEIEDRGADISFGSSGLSVDFAGRSLRRHIGDVLSLMAEQLLSPRIDEAEFEKVMVQIASRVRRSMESTSIRARAGLTASLFRPGHPNHDYSPEEDLEALATITLDDVKAYHERQFKWENLVLSAAGDLKEAGLDGAIASAFASFTVPKVSLNSTTQYDDLLLPRKTETIKIPIPDRKNLDVRFGSGVRLRRNEPEFVPLFVGNYILGGNFSARLMRRVRDELGLTYGISSALAGFDPAFDGFWQIGVTLSQENLDAGIEATMETVREFAEKGISEEELEVKKRTLTGLFKVGLATTRGLAHTMHSHFQNGFEVSYIDEYPEIIQLLTVAEVNEAIDRYLDADGLVTAVAGTLP